MHGIKYPYALSMPRVDGSASAELYHGGGRGGGGGGGSTLQSRSKKYTYFSFQTHLDHLVTKAAHPARATMSRFYLHHALCVSAYVLRRKETEANERPVGKKQQANTTCSHSEMVHNIPH